MFTNSEMIYIPPRKWLHHQRGGARHFSNTLSPYSYLSLSLRLVRANLSPHCVVNYNLSLLPNCPVPFTRSTNYSRSR